MTKRATTDETGNAKTARQKRDGAARARDFRATAKAEGRPLPRDVDAALSEAIAFLVARGKRDGVNIERPAPLELTDLVLGARYILERDGFDPQLSGKAIKSRIEPRDDHERPLYVPSLRPGDPEKIPSPEGREGWSARIDQIVRFFDGPYAITRAR